MGFESLPRDVLGKIGDIVMASAPTWRLGSEWVTSMQLVNRHWNASLRNSEETWCTELGMYFPDLEPKSAEEARKVLRVLSLGRYLTRKTIKYLIGSSVYIPERGASTFEWFGDECVTIYDASDVVDTCIRLGYDWNAVASRILLLPYETKRDYQVQYFLVFVERYLERRGVISDAIRETCVHKMFQLRKSIRKSLVPYLSRMTDAVRFVRSRGFDPDDNLSALNLVASEIVSDLEKTLESCRKVERAKSFDCLNPET